jgi:hypothetical protein
MIDTHECDQHRVIAVVIGDSPRTYQRPPALAAFRPWGIQRDDTARGVRTEVTPRAVIQHTVVAGNLPHGGFA